MSDGFRETNKMTESLTGSVNHGRGVGVVVEEVDRLVKGEEWDHADVRDLAVETAQRGIMVEGWDRHSVQDEGDVLHAEEPHFGGSAGAVHDDMGVAFDVLPLSFCIVLVLVLRFTLPVVDGKSTEDVQNTRADFDLCAITDELIHGATSANGFFKGVYKVTDVLHTVDFDDVGVTSDEDLSMFDVTNSGDVTRDGVSSDGFMATVDIECRKGGPVGITDVWTELGTSAAILGGMLVGLADNVRIFPQEVFLECCEINGDRGQYMSIAFESTGDGDIDIPHVEYLVDRHQSL